ncbi:MAG: archaetidylserine decarboxylase [Longimicrobiales bacterium]
MGFLRHTGWTVVLGAIARLPQGALSRVTGRLADVRLPRPLRSSVLSIFASLAGIDRTEAERPIDEYSSVNEFFVRRLRAGARQWPADEQAIASPVDGILGQTGRITRGQLVQAKGRLYSAASLLDDAHSGPHFDGGAFATIYLSPRHYHRIHAPASGRIPRARRIPGRLLPVNSAALVRFPELFPLNERAAVRIEGAMGAIAVVAVGAYNVGRISLAFDAEWGARGASGTVTNRSGEAAETRVYDPPHPIRRGDEMMAFHLGSTVVLLFEPGRVMLRGDLVPGREVRLGEVIATGV